MKTDEPASLLDLYPTLIDLCDLPPRDGLSGVSLAPQMREPQRDAGRVLISTFDRGNHAVIASGWRYIRYADGSQELYDTSSDPHEWTNLASKPEYAARLGRTRPPSPGRSPPNRHEKSPDPSRRLVVANGSQNSTSGNEHRSTMNRTLFTLACWLCWRRSPHQQNVSAAPPETRRPNILIILADDMGYGDVAALNRDSRIPTPNLDRLASESLVFTDAHCAGSYCVPSRYGLLTGRYMWRTRLGSGGNLANFAGTLIEPGRKTLADLLQRRATSPDSSASGIRASIGSCTMKARGRSSALIPTTRIFENIDFASPVLKGPKDYGFDYSFATAGSAEMNPSTFIENNRVTVIPTLTSEQAKEKYGEWYGRDDNIIAEGHTMDRLVPTLSNKACEFIETAARTRPEQPFFLYYAMTTPHNPIVPNREFVGKSRAGAYGDFVVELDHHVGRILRKIAELGIEKNTIVIFTSDNGPVDRTSGYPARWVRGDTSIYGHDSNGPFRGWKAGLRGGRTPRAVLRPLAGKNQTGRDVAPRRSSSTMSSPRWRRC